MSTAKVIEVIGCSTKSWEDAANQALKRTCKTCRNVTGMQVTQMSAKVRDDKIKEYRTTVKIAFGVEK